MRHRVARRHRRLRRAVRCWRGGCATATDALLRRLLRLLRVLDHQHAAVQVGQQLQGCSEVGSAVVRLRGSKAAPAKATCRPHRCLQPPPRPAAHLLHHRRLRGEAPQRLGGASPLREVGRALDGPALHCRQAPRGAQARSRRRGFRSQQAPWARGRHGLRSHPAHQSPRRSAQARTASCQHDNGAAPLLHHHLPKRVARVLQRALQRRVCVAGMRRGEAQAARAARAGPRRPQPRCRRAPRPTCAAMYAHCSPPPPPAGALCSCDALT